MLEERVIIVEITFNGEKEILDKEYSVLDFLTKNEFSPDIVTVSLNGAILPKEDFGTALLKAGDSVDVLMFMGGGR